MIGDRTLTRDKEVEDLPVGAVVVNGEPKGHEYLFAKVDGGRWKLIDHKDYSYTPHDKLVSSHPEWGAEDGFLGLNLPVYLVSKTGKSEEVAHYLDKWRKG